MLDDYGLLEAVRWYFERFKERTGIKINFTHGKLDGRLPARIETSAYRIIQEALSNAAKHSGAGSIDVRMSHDEAVLNISIQDDGRGFDPEKAPSGMGLTGMQDLCELAGGSLSIDSSPGEGTLISCELPIERQTIN